MLGGRDLCGIGLFQCLAAAFFFCLKRRKLCLVLRLEVCQGFVADLFCLAAGTAGRFLAFSSPSRKLFLEFGELSVEFLCHGLLAGDEAANELSPFCSEFADECGCFFPGLPRLLPSPGKPAGNTKNQRRESCDSGGQGLGHAEQFCWQNEPGDCGQNDGQHDWYCKNGNQDPITERPAAAGQSADPTGIFRDSVSQFLEKGEQFLASR